MATTFFLVLFVSLLIDAVLSLPVDQDLKSVQLSDIKRNDESITRTGAFDPNTILNHGVDTELVKSVDSVPLDRASVTSVVRTKRQVIDGHHSCPDGWRWFKIRCVTLEEYELLTEDYDD